MQTQVRPTIFTGANTLTGLLIGIPRQRTISMMRMDSEQKTTYTIQKEMSKTNLNKAKRMIYRDVQSLLEVGGAIIVRLDGDEVFVIAAKCGQWHILPPDVMEACYCTCAECGEKLESDGTKFINYNIDEDYN